MALYSRPEAAKQLGKHWAWIFLELTPAKGCLGSSIAAVIVAAQVAAMLA
jgi:hypothetical protein